MIREAVLRFDAKREQLRELFKQSHPADYTAVVRTVVEAITGDEDDYSDRLRLDPARIHVIDDGDYQGTLLFVVAEKGYQPDNYWFVKVTYGSCSGCDTLQGITGYSSGLPTDEQANDYLTLALHVVQNLRSMQDGDVSDRDARSVELSTSLRVERDRRAERIKVPEHRDRVVVVGKDSSDL